MPQFILYPVQGHDKDSSIHSCFLRYNADWLNANKESKLGEEQLFDDRGVCAFFKKNDGSDEFSVVVNLISIKQLLVSSIKSEGFDVAELTGLIDNWKAFVVVAKTLLYSYPNQCSLKIMTRGDKDKPRENYSDIDTVLDFVFSGDSEIQALNNEIKALVGDRNRSQKVEFKQAASSFLRLLKKEGRAQEEVKRLHSLVEENNKSVDLEVAHLQVGQLEQELESISNELSRKQAQSDEEISLAKDKYRKLEVELATKECQVRDLRSKLEEVTLSKDASIIELKKTAEQNNKEQLGQYKDKIVELEATIELSSLEISQLEEQLEYFFDVIESKRVLDKESFENEQKFNTAAPPSSLRLVSSLV